VFEPTFSLTIGDLTSTTGNAVAGPQSLTVRRDMDIPADALQVHLTSRSGITLDQDITLDLGDAGDEERVFTGTVVRLRPLLTGVAIFALGQMNELLVLRTASAYENQTAGSIARDLIGQAGLQAGTVDEGPTFPMFTVDRHLSGFAHLKRLADRLGYELYANRDGAVMFHALGPAAGLDAAAGPLGAAGGALSALRGGGEQYQYARHLVQAVATHCPKAWNQVDVGGESPMSAQGDSTAHWLSVNDTDFRGQAGSGDRPLLLLDAVARTKDLADRFAAGRLAVVQRVAHQVQIRVLGRAAVDLGHSLSRCTLLSALLESNNLDFLSAGWG
jgi:hypothetical protein